jgi:hypothetical protein
MKAHQNHEEEMASSSEKQENDGHQPQSEKRITFFWTTRTVKMGGFLRKSLVL